MNRRSAIVCVLLLAACGNEQETNPHPVTCPGHGDYEYADVIVDAPGEVSAPSAINDRARGVNGVVTGNRTSGSLDVFSRGLSADPPNHYIVLRWSGRRVVDVDGADIVVFENAFEANGSVFMDHAIVEVSNDGERWVAFPYDYVAEDETRYSNTAKDWHGFAGTTPVLWQSETCTSPFGSDAGGDRFDLADLDDEELREGFTFLRITAAPTVENPDTGEPFVKDFISDGFDLDGVFAEATE